MAEASQALQRRPWTPTETPSDATYKAPVIYYGDHQLDRREPNDSSDDDGPSSRVSPIEKDVTGDESAKPRPLRFRPSQMLLRDDTAAFASEAQTYHAFRLSQATSPVKEDAPYPLRSQRSSQVLSAVGDRSPAALANNPFRLSQTLKAATSEEPQAKSQQRPELPSAQKSDQKPAYGPHRARSLSRSESTEDLLVKTQRPAEAPKLNNSESIQVPKQKRNLQAPVVKADDDLPSVTGTSTRQIKILLVNPNSTSAMTERCLNSISESLPPNVTVYGFTASRPAPTAIESHTDAAMSTAACTKAILPMAAGFDAFLVACFSQHPLIAALREQLMQPVIGIMEASLYASRMVGSKFGIVTTGARSMYLLDSSVKSAYSLDAFSAGVESARTGVLDLERRPVEDVEQRLATAARKLQSRGADSICLGCAGMTGLQKACQDAVGMHDRVAMVIDGVAVGIHFLTGLVRENLGTAKGAAYNTSSGHRSLKGRG